MSTEPYVDVQVDQDWQPFHGYTSWPPSRALVAKQNGSSIDPQSLEGGQGFPSRKNPSQLGQHPVPKDGALASATTGWTFLDEVTAPNGQPWPATRVRPGGTYHFSWVITASHKTRLFHYFITRDDWDPSQPLTRAQFETDPFVTIDWDAAGHWPRAGEKCRSVPSQIHHWVRLPHKQGRHVIYPAWWIADTDKAFYPTTDVLFDPAARVDDEDDEA